jgi:NAD(P)H-hydrate epimerase
VTATGSGEVAILPPAIVFEEQDGSHMRGIGGNELLTVAEMGRADALAVAAGVPAERLMEAAGKAVADAILARWSACPTVVLAGPGNNGGDGYVAARYLAEAGWPVRVASLETREGLKGEAALNARRWTGETVPLSVGALDGCALVVDALFGAGLTRPLGGVVREVIAALAVRNLPCNAVDMPSGIHGDSGLILGESEGGLAPKVQLTVTFFRKKPGHLLLPGRVFCGGLVVADIGIPPAVLGRIEPKAAENAPLLWFDRLPWPQPTDHKFSRGHTVVCGGAEMTGAARLSARAAQRAGAGMVTITASPQSFAIYASSMQSILVRPIEDLADFNAFLADPRVTSVVIGPGNGVLPATRARGVAALEAGKACVLDADALTVFSERPQGPKLLFETIASNMARCVLTPHEGEFARLFGPFGLAGGSKTDRALEAARLSGAVVLLKGFDTVIAAPDGRVVINSNAPATLATAGAGDVLAGLIGGLLAQGMPPYEAACAAAWLQGEAAAMFGAGLIAEDVIDRLPDVLGALRAAVYPPVSPS